jgi:hypothetical protein
MGYEKSEEFVFLLKNGEFASPVKLKSGKTGNLSFRSAPQSENKLGTNWLENEVELSEKDMVSSVLDKKRRTRCISPSNPKPSLKGPKSGDVAAVYVLQKST